MTSTITLLHAANEHATLLHAAKIAEQVSWFKHCVLL